MGHQPPSGLRLVGQHQHTGGEGRRGERAGRGQGGRGNGRQREIKRGPGALLPAGAYPNRAAVELHQPLADRQPQPQAAVASLNAPLGAAKLVKDQRLFFQRDAQAGVTDGDCDLGPLAAQLQADPPASGELDRITHQVERDLAQASAIPPDPRPGGRQHLLPDQPFIRG